MGNFLGAKHTVGFKPQAVAGTPETTVTTFLVTETAQMHAKPTNIERKTYIGTGRKLPPRVGWIKPEGKAKTEVHASLPHPWYWCLGSVSTTTPSSGVKLHTITESDSGPVNLTAEMNRVYDGARQGDVKISKLKLSGKTGEVATLEVEWMGLTHTDGATLTSTPTFVTDVLTVRSATINLGGSQNVTIENFEIEYDPVLEQLATIESATGAPHVVRKKEPTKVAGKLHFIDYPTAEFTKLRNATSFALVVELDGDVISGQYSKFLRVTLPACVYTGGFDPDISEAVITGDGDFEGFYDTSTSRQILVEAQNAISDITI